MLPNVQAALKTEAAKLAGLDHEHVVVLDGKTGEVLYSACSLSEEMRDQLGPMAQPGQQVTMPERFHGTNVVMLHNHPSATPFSPQDILASMGLGVGTTAVVSTSGTLYHFTSGSLMRKNAPWLMAEPFAFANQMNDTYRDAVEEYGEGSPEIEEAIFAPMARGMEHLGYPITRDSVEVLASGCDLKLDEWMEENGHTAFMAMLEEVLMGMGSGPGIPVGPQYDEECDCPSCRGGTGALLGMLGGNLFMDAMPETPNKLEEFGRELIQLGYLYATEYEKSDGRKVVKWVHPTKGKIVLVERFSLRGGGRPEAVECYIATKDRTVSQTITELREYTNEGA